MTREEHLKYCSVCAKRKLDKSRGLLCSLTNEFADFQATCSHYEMDAKAMEIRTKEERQKAAKKLQDDTLGLSKYGVKNVSIAAGIVMTFAVLWLLIGVLYVNRVFIWPIILFIIALIALIRDVTKEKSAEKLYTKMRDSDILDN